MATVDEDIKAIKKCCDEIISYALSFKSTLSLYQSRLGEFSDVHKAYSDLQDAIKGLFVEVIDVEALRNLLRHMAV